MSKLPAHLFVSSSDGALYDTRIPSWSSQPPLRANYQHSHRWIESVADLKATLRNGLYVWPGGYPLYFLCSDNEAMSFDSVKENLRLVMRAIRDKDNSGWRVIGCAINCEDNDLYCVHSGEKIESAYGEDESATK
jgi:hypothetical protein